MIPLGLNFKNNDAYHVYNREDQEFDFPANCDGVIGITLDDKIVGVRHSLVHKFNVISTKLQNIDNEDLNYGIQYENLMHAFIVTNQSKPGCFEVCEAIRTGFTAAQIKIGDSDWTSMILFVPKEQGIRNEIMKNAITETTSNREVKPAGYAFYGGVISVFSKKNVSSENHNRKIILSEMAYLIKGESIKDRNGNPSCAVCSHLATRVLRSSILIAGLDPKKISKYKKMDQRDLEKKLHKKISKEGSSLNSIYHSSDIFKVDAGHQTLPFELYNVLIKESDIH